jgi:cytochrome b561
MSANSNIGRNGYSSVQIALHWVIAALIVCQFVFHEGMVEAWDTYRKTPDTPLVSGLAAQAHVWGGLAVLAFGVWRLWLRNTRGVPAVPADEPAILRLAAHVTHVTLYALMILMPVTGAMLWFGGIGFAAFLHGVLRIPLFFLVALHVAGGLVQHFYFRSSVLTRMMKPEA